MKNSGFTLIELLVVIGIIALILGFAAGGYTNAQKKTRDLARKNDLKQLQKALELYKDDRSPQSYPATDDLLVSEYIKEIPIDPREKGTPNSWGPYTYVIDPLNSLKYTMTACLENTSDPEGGVACGAGSLGKLYTLTEP